MVEIYPFAALRHACVPPDRMGEVSSPPYDLFTAEMQRTFHERHPQNIVRLIQGEIRPEERGDEGRIERAAAFLSAWREDEILKFDSKPALYPYRQIFTVPSGASLERRSFFATLRLERFGEGRIFPHEHTFPKPKSYLYGLWGKCGAHLGPVFGFFDDPSRAPEKALSPVVKMAPIADFEEESVCHTLWRCEDEGIISTVRQALAECDVFIADGHHRYETSLRLRDAARAEGAAPGGEIDRLLICLANLSDPGMIVLPTHRLLMKTGSSLPEALRRLGNLYDVQEAPDPGPGAGPGVAEVLKGMGDDGKRTAFCLSGGRGTLHYLLRRRDAPAEKSDSPEAAVSTLDVSRLHSEVLEDAFGVSKEEAIMEFTPDPEAALSAAREGICSVAFLLNPTPIEAVTQIARAGGRMPQKSTYFYPKLRTGLVMHAFAPPAAD